MSDHGTRSRYVGDGRHPSCRCAACRDAQATYERTRAAKVENRPVAEARKLRRMLRPEAWQDDAACKGVDPDLMVPWHQDSVAADAKAVCAECPVKKQCLDFAMRNREEWGIWGGLNPAERRALRRRIQRRARKFRALLEEAS